MFLWEKNRNENSYLMVVLWGLNEYNYKSFSSFWHTIDTWNFPMYLSLFLSPGCYSCPLHGMLCHTSFFRWKSYTSFSGRINCYVLLEGLSTSCGIYFFPPVNFLDSYYSLHCYSLSFCFSCRQLPKFPSRFYWSVFST